jgi:Protein of unknown function (DUF2378)
MRRTGNNSLQTRVVELGPKDVENAFDNMHEPAEFIAGIFVGGGRVTGAMGVQVVPGHHQGLKCSSPQRVRGSLYVQAGELSGARAHCHSSASSDAPSCSQPLRSNSARTSRAPDSSSSRSKKPLVCSAAASSATGPMR